VITAVALTSFLTVINHVMKLVLFVIDRRDLGIVVVMVDVAAVDAVVVPIVAIILVAAAVPVRTGMVMVVESGVLPRIPANS
jgi:hypothetical protein